jgi:hypothetical protein
MTPPSLDCPECGVPLIPATGRGYYDEDGEYCEHREGCECHRCEWMWFDDTDPTSCTCGAKVLIRIDDQHAYAYALPTGEPRS